MPAFRLNRCLLLAPLLFLGASGQADPGGEDLRAVRAFEERLQGVVERVLPAVVTVGLRADVAAHRTEQRSGGSGVIISADGYVLTCEHVTEGESHVLVGLNDGRTLDATVVGRDVLGDLALLKVELEGHPFARLGDSEALQVGDWVLALGNPFGLARSDHSAAATLGIVSALHRYQGGTKVYGDALQIDAAVNPGNSGGPLFDLRGRVVGINGRISIRGLARHNVGVGFAIPAHQVELVLDDLKAGRDVTRGYLGVRFLTRSDGKPGVRVSEVTQGSPAARAGIRSGDRLTRVGERAIDHPVRLQNYLSVIPAGRSVRLTVARGRETFTVDVTLAPRPGGPR